MHHRGQGLRGTGKWSRIDGCRFGGKCKKIKLEMFTGISGLKKNSSALNSKKNAFGWVDGVFFKAGKGLVESSREAVLQKRYKTHKQKEDTHESVCDTA